MNIPTPQDLRKKRESLGLTQEELAERSGLSQSMIARIESGTVDPRVSTLRKVISVLIRAERARITARNIMTAPVYSVLPEDPITRAAGIMEERGISQVPVVKDGVPVGCISETALITALEARKSSRAHVPRVGELMESGFPTIPPDADLDTVMHILQNNRAVLVVDRGAIQGVITKHDLISLIGGEGIRPGRPGPAVPPPDRPP